MEDFDVILYVDATKISQRKIFQKRKARVDEAMRWSIGTENNREYHTVWEKGEYCVALGKPGKEALPGYRGKNNPYDMRPTIFYRKVDMEKKATFQDVVKDLEEVGKKHTKELELLGCLLFRSAFLLDHIRVNTNQSEEVYRYYPNDFVINKINESVKSIYGVPTEVFLHYLDAIALNEDVKYTNLGYDLETKNTGGRNNLLTYVNLIAVISGKKPLYTLADPLLRSGVAAINQREAFEFLPHISGKNAAQNKQMLY